MKKMGAFIICLLGFILASFIVTLAVRAQERDYRKIYKGEMSCEGFEKKYKNYFDDPKPLLKDLGYYKKILPPDVYAKQAFDIETMKTHWAEVVGFKAPDVVGKIAAEIKPGTYTYKDKERLPELKELMIPELYEKFAPGGPPHIGNFPEMKIVPTTQLYWSLPISEATKKNMNLTKQDKQGYIIGESYVAGIPFPRPSGEFKAQQVLYNWEKRYINFESGFLYQSGRGFKKNLTMDYESTSVPMWFLKTQGRVQMEPLGWFDERARKNEETRIAAMLWLAPRDEYGNAFTIVNYSNPNTFDQFLIYISALRRIRKLSSTDSQDPMSGSDLIYDDNEGFNQKLSPKRYPYKFELIADREYLFPVTFDYSRYLSSKGLEFHNLEFQRRPMYVVKLTQLDKSYVYSKRIIYFDKETFHWCFSANYDQKGRLYRTAWWFPGFAPEMGMIFTTGIYNADHIDWHSFHAKHFVVPAPWITRDHTNIQMFTRTK